jgi:hypothetical protein
VNFSKKTKIQEKIKLIIFEKLNLFDKDLSIMDNQYIYFLMKNAISKPFLFHIVIQNT